MASPTRSALEDLQIALTAQLAQVQTALSAGLRNLAPPADSQTTTAWLGAGTGLATPARVRAAVDPSLLTPEKEGGPPRGANAQVPPKDAGKGTTKKEKQAAAKKKKQEARHPQDRATYGHREQGSGKQLGNW